MSDESFYVWGWRIPFLASAILIGLSMYIQLTMEDTKAFQELQAARENQQARGYQNNNVIKKSPIIEAIKKYPGRISLAAGAFLSVQVTFYILIAFTFAKFLTLSISIISPSLFLSLPDRTLTFNPFLIIYKTSGASDIIFI